MIIREANILDHTGICYSIIDQIQSRILDYPVVNRSLSTWVNGVLTNGISFVAIDEKTGLIVGTIGMGVGFFPWNDEVSILKNEWFHVHKDYRNDNTASKLIDAAKGFAESKKMILVIDVVNDKKVEKIDKFLEIKGMRYMGGNFIYGLGE